MVDLDRQWTGGMVDSGMVDSGMVELVDLGIMAESPTFLYIYISTYIQWISCICQCVVAEKQNGMEDHGFISIFLVLGRGVGRPRRAGPYLSCPRFRLFHNITLSHNSINGQYRPDHAFRPSDRPSHKSCHTGQAISNTGHSREYLAQNAEASKYKKVHITFRIA